MNIVSKIGCSITSFVTMLIAAPMIIVGYIGLWLYRLMDTFVTGSNK